ncbi:MAG: IS21 family transposase [Bacillota bacterium]
MKDVQDWIAVKRLFKRGVKIKQIAKQLKMSKNTVKSLLLQKSEPKYYRAVYVSIIDPFKEQIKTWYLNPEYDFIGTRIFNELKKIGYEGSTGPLYRYLKTLKDEKREVTKKATVRVETPLGDQAQFDWSTYKMVIDNEIKEVYCFTMILCASRMKAITFSLTCDAKAIYEAIQELFEDLGGVTRELVTDNPKALVIENDGENEPKFNLDALRLATHLGMELNPCNPYRARTKGKIEKPYQYIEEQFVKGNSFKSMTELNLMGKEFIRNWCKQVHGTTRRIPEEFFKEEWPCLLPLPSKRFIIETLIKRDVSFDSLVSIDTNKYSVPVKYVGKEVQYRIVYGYKIEIYDMKMNLIDAPAVKNGKNGIFRIDDHYTPISSKVPKSIPEIKRQLVKTFKVGEKYLELASKALQQPSYHARQILKLRELYTVESLDKILDYCIKNSIFDIDGIKDILKNKYIEIVFGDNVDFKANPNTSSYSLARDLSYYEGGGQN